MFRYRIFLCLLQLAVLAAKAQDADYIRALRNYSTVDLYSGKMADIGGSNHLAIPVKIKADSVSDSWILYDATAQKPLIKDTFDFIFDYSISSTLSGVLYKKTIQGKQALFYRTWPGYPGTADAATTIDIDVLHQDKFVHDYIGITETGKQQPCYLHISGNRVQLPQVPDSAYLYPFKDDVFQVVGVPAGPLLLLVNKLNYTTYTSISAQPDNILLVNKNNRYWYLRFAGGHLDSIGPYTAAQDFAEDQDYGIVKDDKGVYEIVSLNNFTSYPIPWQAGEEVDALVRLKDTNLIACKYRTPARIWRLFKWAGTHLDTVDRDLKLSYDQDIFPVYKAAVVVSDPGGDPLLLPAIGKPGGAAESLPGVAFSSLGIYRHYYEIPPPIKKKGKLMAVSIVVTGQNVNDNSLKNLYFIQNGKLLAHKDSVSALSFPGGRFLVYKRRNNWHWQDVESPTTNLRQAGTYRWITPFIALERTAPRYFATALKDDIPEPKVVYLDEKEELLDTKTEVKK
ncbi:hypothetical protein Q4E93_20525 [Flavitalea sp. BT771]|uniref:hypothetical protein n=1 Tax=Flavitalea sp. BT771 TaxID=3063329 RepID=UPI0026E2F034|nr:hypothetical protein [Flavitalea sp. BT771]MDO6433005.1 hypothetical protein [Flavitalea sp. BT771]MDV6221719.1 hypothetical protein [Flavitalea sp. BT771]